MTKKQKTGEVKTFILRDPDTNKLIYDANGRTLKVHGYTLKTARHQAKVLFGKTPILELAN